MVVGSSGWSRESNPAGTNIRLMRFTNPAGVVEVLDAAGAALAGNALGKLGVVGLNNASTPSGVRTEVSAFMRQANAVQCPNRGNTD